MVDISKLNVGDKVRVAEVLHEDAHARPEMEIYCGNVYSVKKIIHDRGLNGDLEWCCILDLPKSSRYEHDWYWYRSALDYVEEYAEDDITENDIISFFANERSSL